MRKILLIIFFIFSFINVDAQYYHNKNFKVDPNLNNRTFLTGWLSANNSLDIHGGIFYCDFKKLNKELDKKYKKTIDNKLSAVGISLKETFNFNRHIVFEGHITYQYLLPKQSVFSDSLNFKLKGYHIGLDMGKDLFPKVRFFDLVVSVGFNTGRLKMLRKDLLIAKNDLEYRNPFFSPKIVIEPKFIIIKKITIFVRGEYLFDVSKANWHLKDWRLPAMGDTKSTGLIIQGGIGIKI